MLNKNKSMCVYIMPLFCADAVRTETMLAELTVSDA